MVHLGWDSLSVSEKKNKVVNSNCPFSLRDWWEDAEVLVFLVSDLLAFLCRDVRGH